MTNPFSPNEPIQPGPQQVEDLITSPVLVRALESDECCLVLDHVPVAIAVARQVGNAQRICFANNAFQALTGLSGSDIEGQNWTILDAFVHEDEASMPLSRAVTHGEDFLGTFAMPQNGNGPSTWRTLQVDRGLCHRSLADPLLWPVSQASRYGRQVAHHAA